MRTLILSWLLHHANRSGEYRSKFYPIKDRILKAYGKEIGYDIQHIPGKKCHSCGGTGQHARYSNTYPYKPYDWDDCWHCFGGWYKLPQWNCLARIRFGRYTFHKPIKREERVKNPWTEDKMGWKVMDRPVIKGYIDHTASWFSEWALLILFRIYDREAYQEYWPARKSWIRWRWFRFKQRLNWRSLIMSKPKLIIREYYDDQFCHTVDDDDFPF